MKGVIFCYLLTAFGTLSPIFNPYYGLLVYICFATLKPEYMWQYSLGPAGLSRYVGIGLLAGWAFHGFGSWQLGRATGIVIAYIGFWLTSVYGLSLVSDYDRGFVFVEAHAKTLLPFLVGITTIHSIKQVKQLVWVIVLSQAYVAFEINRMYYQEYEIVGRNMLLDDGWGWMDNNSVAIGMDTCIGLAFFLGLHAEKWWQKGLAFFATGLMAHAVFISMSRGGMVSLIMIGVVIFLLIPKRPMHMLILAAAIFVTINMTGDIVRERFKTAFASEADRDGSAQGRIELWHDCLDAISKQPLFGYGPMEWGIVATRYGWPPGKEAHSTWLQTTVELGVVGAGCLIIFYLIGVVRLIPIARESSQVPDPWFRYCARMVLASFAGFAASAQFVSLVGLEHPYYIWLVGAAVLKLLSVTPSPVSQPVREPAVAQAPMLVPSYR